MGLTQQLDDRTEKAAVALKKAIAWTRLLRTRISCLATSLESDNKLAEALPIFETAIQKQPDLYIGYFYYGKILAKMNDGRLEQAIQALRKSTTLRPEFAEGHYELGWALEHAGQTDEAIAEYKASLERDPALAAERLPSCGAVSETGRHRERQSRHGGLQKGTGSATERRRDQEAGVSDCETIEHTFRSCSRLARHR